MYHTVKSITVESRPIYNDRLWYVSVVFVIIDNEDETETRYETTYELNCEKHAMYVANLLADVYDVGVLVK